jgi:hypothetical protein
MTIAVIALMMKAVNASRIIGRFLPDYTVQHPRTQLSSWLLNICKSLEAQRTDIYDKV